jgi:DNA-binding transcriptional MerR regulator
MAYTVKQLAVMSGVTVRTLHFYDEMALLKPSYSKANGYRIYEEPQLLMLQQILFYRELGFELKRIKEILSQRKFEKLAALKSHRQVLEKNVTRTCTLIETIDKTISHLKGTKRMKSEELFMGFSIGAGKDRFNDGFNRYGTTIDCKVSGKDTGGAMCFGGEQHRMAAPPQPRPGRMDLRR